MANLKEIEQYLKDFDNLRDTGHFQNVSVRDYTFYHKDFTLPEMMSKGREYIRQLLMIHKGVVEKRPNEDTKALPLHSVVFSEERAEVKCTTCKHLFRADANRPCHDCISFSEHAHLT